MNKRLILAATVAMFLGCGGDKDDEVTGNKALWPAGWKVYDEHLIDPSFVNDPELDWHGCGETCYWTGIFECPTEEVNHVAAGFEAGVDCDFDFYGGLYGEPDIVPLDNGKVLFKFSEQTLYELSLDGSPGRQVGALPPGFMEDDEVRGVLGINYREVERTPDGRVYALASADLDGRSSAYSAYIIVELEGPDLTPRLIAQLNFERSLTDIISNLMISPELNLALVLENDSTVNGDLHQINLATGDVTTLIEGSHRFRSDSLLALNGRAYTTGTTDSDADTFLVEVDIETGTENPVPFPDISDEDWYTIAGRHLVQNTMRMDEGYLTLQSKGDGDARHIWIDSEGNSKPLHDDYFDPTLGLLAPPFFVNGTLYAIAHYEGGTYERTALWYMEDPQRL